MYRVRKQRKYIIMSLFFIVLIMSGAYAAFQSNLKIKGTTRITSLWDIRITNVTAGTPTGSATNAVAPTWEKLTANMEANLYEKGDAMEYDVTITNNGTVDAILSDIIGTPSNSQAVIITFSGYAKGEKLYKKGHEGNTKVVHVKIAYNPEYDGGETSGEANVEFDFTQGEGGNVDPGNNQSLITYNYTYNGGAVSQAVDEYVANGTTITLNKTATKPGWTFIGWNTNRDATTGLASIVVNSNTTVYAIYSKTLTATYQKSENVESISKTSDSCVIYNLQTGCTKTLPTITPKPGYTSDTWYNGTVVVGHGGDTYELRSNVTLTTAENANRYQVVYNYSENGGTSSTKTQDSVEYNKNIDLTPTATKAGWTFVGWNTDKNAHVGLESLKMGTTDVTLYAIYRKEAITLTAKFNGNGATLSSTANKTCTLAAVYNKEVQNTSCTVDAPTIAAPEKTPTVVGFNTSANATTNNASYDSSTGKITLTASNDDNTWYAITTKALVNRTITFYRNGNTSFTYNGTRYTDTSKAFTICTIPATYNGAAQPTSCSATISMPTIEAANTTQNIIGWSTGASIRTATHASGQESLTLTMEGNLEYYAQTKKDVTITFNKNGATNQTNSSGTKVTTNTTTRACTMYNGAANCSVTSPAVERSGFTIAGYADSASATTATWNVSTARNVSANATWYVVSSKNVTLTFNKNGNTSQTNLSGTASTDDTVTRSCTIQNSATTCSITAPTIVAPSGFTVKGYSEGATTYSNYWTHNTAKSVSANATWFAQSEKAAVDRTITFYKNGNTSFTYSGTKYTDTSKTFTVCTIPAVHNGTAQDASCSATITMPTIEAASTTQTLIGWSNSATNRTAAYTSGQTGVALTMTGNLSYYAQTKKDVTITFNKNGATNQTNSSGTKVTTDTTTRACTMYNGAANCSVTSPAVERSGFTIAGYADSASATTATWNVSTARNVSANATWYVVSSKNVTLTFNKNGNTSQTNLSGTASTDDTVTRSCTIQNSATTCSITAPTIVAPNGFTVKGYSEGATTYSNYWTHNTAKNVSANATWFAQSEKAAVDRTITFYKNGNTSFTYSGTKYTDTSKSFTVCTIPATYNGTAQDASCSATITMPTIEAASTTQTLIGWSNSATNRTAAYTSGQASVALTMTGNLSYYAQTKKDVTITFNKNGATNQTNSSGTKVTTDTTTRACTMYNGAANCSVTSPAVERSGFTIAGYADSASATTATWNVSTARNVSANATWYVVSSKDVTLTFKKNGNVSQTNSSGTASTDDSVTRSCTIQNSATTCSITAPTIVAPSGFTVKGYSVGATTYSNYWTHNTAKNVSANATWFAQSEKAAVDRTITFNRNGNPSFTYNGTVYTDTSKTFALCTIPASHNGTAQDASCSATITLPTITAHGNTPTLIGWSNSATNRDVAYTSGQADVTIMASSNLSYYAQTTKEAQTFTLTYGKEIGVDTLSKNSDSCSLTQTYNGEAQAGNCTVTLPTFTVENGYTKDGFYNGNTKVGNENVAISVNSNLSLSAKATANIYEITLDGGAVQQVPSKVYYQYKTTKVINNVTCYYYSDSALTTCLSGGYNITPPTRAGYTFGGYYTGENGSGTQYVNSSGSFINNAYQTVGNKTLNAKWTANTYNINYTLNGGNNPSTKPTSGTYDANVQISNPTKTITVTGNANGTGATVGSATSKAQTFAGWTSTTIGSNAKTGTSSNPTTAWDGTSTTNTYFKNLRESGTVTMVANWTPVSFNLPTVSKTGYTCTWNTESDGSGTSYNSGASYTPTATSSSMTLYAICGDVDKPTATISGGTEQQSQGQDLTLKCTDTAGVAAYYWGTTEPTSASAITTTTAADLTALQGSGLSKPGITNGTYYLGCKDADGNFDVASIIIRKYVVNNLLETIAGTRGTYTNSNYTSKSTSTYYIKNGTTITLTSAYTMPEEASSGTFKGYSTVYSTTAANPSTSNPTVATNNTTTYYMWFNRKTYNVTVSKPTNGTVKAETVTQGSNSVTVTPSSSGNGSLTVKHGDTVKATATPNNGYSFSGWSGGYVSGTTNPATGGQVTAAKTITGSFGDITKPVPTITGGTTLKQTSQSLTLKCTDTVGVTAYYWGTTEPTSASAITTTTAADLTSLQGSGLSKTGITNGTYYLGCRDAAGNFEVTSATIRKYQVQNVLETIAATSNTTYTNANYATTGSASTYYVKSGTTLTLASIYSKPTGGNTFKGFTTAAPSATAQTPSTTAPTVAANDTTVYYMWWTRLTYNVTVSKPTNGTVTAETVTQTGNSVTASTAATNLTVKYGDTVKATATPASGYSFSGWSGGYVSGTTNPVTGGQVTAAKTITGSFGDITKPVPTITGGTTLKQTSQSLTLKCTDTVGVTAYYWGTTEPTSADDITTTTAADLTSLQGSGLSKTGITNGTYYLGCRDAAGNFEVTSATIRKYQVQNVLETIAATSNTTYTNANYATTGSASTYYVKSGTTLTLASIYSKPTGGNTFKGFTTAAPSATAQTPSTTAPTVAANDTTVYYMWWTRLTYNVTVSKPTNGTVTAETVTQTGNSVTASTAATNLTVKYGDTVKATATPASGYSFSGWSGGYVSGTTNPVTGGQVTAAKTITGSFGDITKPVPTITGGTALKQTSQSLTLKCTDTVGVTAYYWGTTEPTSADDITTTTAADLTSLQGSGLSKTGITNGTYYLGCRDAAGNFEVAHATIRKYQVQNVLETIAATSNTTYTNANYATTGSASTYYVKSGTTLTLASIYSKPTGGNTFKGFTTAAPSATAQTPSTTAPTVAANDTTVYYMWWTRLTYNVTVSKPTNGTVTAETVTQTGNSVTASTAATNLTVKYGDTVKATATPANGYSFSGWSGGYVSGTTNPATGGQVTAAKTITGSFGDITKPVPTITGGTTLKQTSQSLTLKCTDTVGVTAYYWGTTEPTSADDITTTTAADLTSLQGSGLSKTGITNGTYYLGCRDAAGNFDVESITIRRYQVQNVLETIAATSNTTYTNANYATTGSASTYSVKDGTTLTLASIYSKPTGGNTFKGFTTAAPSATAQTPSTTAPTVAANDTTVYYMWWTRLTYNVTVSKPTNGTVTAETVTQTGNSVTASTAATNLTVKHGDTVKATATPNDGYSFSSWSGGYVSGTANPVTGGQVTAAKTITGAFTAIDYTITITSGTGISSLSATGWTGTGTGTISKTYHIGDVIDLTDITPTYKTGYTGLAYSKTSGSGTLNTNSFTVGAGAASLSFKATGLVTPTCTMQGGATKVYNQSATTLTATSVSSNYDTDSVDISYSFGYAANGTGTLGNYSAPGGSNTYSVAKNLFRGTRYYGVQIIVTDMNDETITSTCTSGTNSSAATGTTVANRTTMTLVNSRIAFNATTNGGTLTGTSPLYVSYGGTGYYTGRTNTTAGSLPTANAPVGYTFNGWYTAASGGSKVINADGTLTGVAVSGWTNASKQWVKTSTTDTDTGNILYAQYTVNTYDITYTLNGGNNPSTNPTSGTYNADVQISNPTKTVTVTGNANGTGATIGSATSKAQTFAGWTSETIGSNAKTGISSNPTTAWDGTKTTNTYFKNLRESGTVTMEAKWTPVSLNLPTVSKTGYTCTWNTEADGSGTSYNSGASYTPTDKSPSSITLYAICGDTEKPSSSIIGGEVPKQTSQNLTLKCSDTAGVTAYYWGTTQPTSASAITTTTSADLTALQGSGLSKNVAAKGTYYLGCKDSDGNFDVSSIIIREYKVRNVLETIAGTTGTYTSSNYASVGSAASTYYIKNGTTLPLSTDGYDVPTESTQSGKFKGYTTAAPSSTAKTLSTTAPVISNDTTTYYMWFDRNTYIVVLEKPVGGSVKIETTTQTGNSLTLLDGAGSNGLLTVKHGDSVKATATPSNGYIFGSWARGYVYGTTTPTTGDPITGDMAITGFFVGTPTFQENTAGEVVITYPSGCLSPYSCKYKIGNGSDVTVSSSSTTVSVGEDEVVTATATNGNSTSSTYTVIRNNLYVSSTGNDTTGYGTVAHPYASIARAYEAATSTGTSTIYVMNNITHRTTALMDDSKDIILTSSDTSGVAGTTRNNVTRSSALTQYLINQSNGTLSLDNIVISGNNVTTQYPMIRVAGQAEMSVSTIIQRGKNNSSSTYGAAVYVCSSGQFTKNGGYINNNTSTLGGAGIAAVNSATVTLKGSTGIYGNSGANGGSIFIDTNATLNMISGEITESSGTNGGAIYTKGTVNLSGGFLYENGATTGGAIFGAEGSVINVNGVSINNNTASDAGGGICANGSLNITSGSINKNSAARAGGIFVSSTSSTTMSGGTIGGTSSSYANTASNGAAGVENFGTFNMTGGTISYNSGAKGGAIYSGGTLTVTGGSITNNSVTGYKDFSGGIFNSYGGHLTIGGNCTIDSNTAYQDGNIADMYADNLNNDGRLDDNRSGYWNLNSTNTQFHIFSKKNTNFVLDVDNGTVANGTNVDIWTAGNGENQNFAIKPYKVLSGKIYYVISAQGDQTVNNYGNTSNLGTSVKTWEWATGINGSLWSIDSAGSADYWIFKTYTGSLCLDIAGGTMANGTDVDVWTCSSSSDHQKWAFAFIKEYRTDTGQWYNYRYTQS